VPYLILFLYYYLFDDAKLRRNAKACNRISVVYLCLYKHIRNKVIGNQ